MNILTSYNWIKEYLKTDLSPEDFANEMSLKGMAIESIDYLKEKYENVVIGLVDEIKDHPDADKLKIAITDIGSKKVQVVCGGVNLAEGMRVVVALPGSKVRWHGEGDWVELKETKIRGEKSFGMICAAEELGFEKYPSIDHGIWDFGEISEAAAGTSFVEAFDLDDVIFDVEVTSNRVDAMSMIGLALEGAASTGGEFNFPPPPSIPDVGAGHALPLKVTVEEKELCPRYLAVVIDNVKVEPSPAWLQKKLLLSGHRPINNIVDITNYILHEYGQPLHAFDYDELKDGEIIIRKAKEGEKFLALDDNEYELKSSNLVIADSEKPVAVAGVMGGRNSGTKDNTRTIVFEAATFEPISVRKTSRALGLYSDSQLLFEKGLSTQLPKAALERAVELVLEVAGGEVVSEVIDEQAEEYVPIKYPLRPEKIREMLGVVISDEEIVNILKSLLFMVEKNGDDYEVEVPFWRDHDIEHEVDLSEEVARIYGYHNLPSTIPAGVPPTEPEDMVLFWEGETKRFLAAAGYTELYGYSFTSANAFTRYDLDPNDAVVLHNPLTSDLTHMRTSLMPSLLMDIERNQGQVTSGKLFNLNQVYLPRKNDLPSEETRMIIAEYGMDNVLQSFLRVKGVLEKFAEMTGLKLSYKRTEDTPHWHPTRSSVVLVDGEEVGTLGQVDSVYQNAFGINKPVVVLDFNYEAVSAKLYRARAYEEIPEYPAIERDLAVLVDVQTEYAELASNIKGQSSIIESVDLVDIYKGAGIPEGKKSVTLAVVLRAPDKTLSSEHANDVMNAVQKSLKEKFDAILR